MSSICLKQANQLRLETTSESQERKRLLNKEGYFWTLKNKTKIKMKSVFKTNACEPSLPCDSWVRNSLMFLSRSCCRCVCGHDRALLSCERCVSNSGLLKKFRPDVPQLLVSFCEIFCSFFSFFLNYFFGKFHAKQVW